MANNQEKVLYYEQIYQHIKSVNYELKVIGNPGTSYTLEDYLRTAEKLVIFEGSIANYADFKPLVTAPWVANYPSERFANIVYAAASNADRSRALDKAARSHAGSVYITHGSLPNPYDGLPHYWVEEVAAIRARDLSASSRQRFRQAEVELKIRRGHPAQSKSTSNRR
jgi:hypothetical protein